MTPYEIVKKACIEANPDILKLEFGCRVKINVCGKDMDVMIDESDVVPNGEDGIKFSDSDCYDCTEILGREIRLADVLLALKRGHSDVWGKYWNLKYDSLSWHRDNQPETVEFLAKLLGKD